MLLTSLQHRGIAKHLRQKAAALPGEQPHRADRMRRSARVHLGLARAQENDPSYAPAAKSAKNSVPPSQQLKPSLVLVRA